MAPATRRARRRGFRGVVGRCAGEQSPGRSGPGVRRAYVARSERPQRFGPYVEQRGLGAQGIYLRKIVNFRLTYKKNKSNISGIDEFDAASRGRIAAVPRAAEAGFSKYCCDAARLADGEARPVGNAEPAPRVRNLAPCALISRELKLKRAAAAPPVLGARRSGARGVPAYRQNVM